MPAQDLHDPNDRTAAGLLIATLYCHGCDEYSGGGLCRVCQRGQGEIAPDAPGRTSVAIVCGGSRGCEPAATPDGQHVLL